ncbi:MAG: hypothetical protein HUU21_02045 [Polyangiaceae bacterium]|nr:hypothetical protein [Polyangiaceae bacterium]
MSEHVFRIHPSIGFARVGNSESFYLAPETIAGLPLPDRDDLVGGLPIRAGTESEPITNRDLRDERGALKRQAARFRIFGYARQDAEAYPNGAGTEIVIGSEIDGRRVVDIVWTVHLANKKSNCYQLIDDQGVDAYKDDNLPPLRNPKLGPEASDVSRRARLVIDPGPRAILGSSREVVRFDARTPVSFADAAGEIYHNAAYAKSFPDDSFTNMLCPRGPIDTLGEIRADERGRLIVTGGYGRAAAFRKRDGQAYPLAADVNNDGWFDDTSDGPVSAVIRFHDGTTAEVHGAWVVSTDPGYAPQTLNVVSLWDDICNTWVRDFDLRPDVYSNGAYQRSYRPAFETEIWPIFRAADLQRWNTNLPQMAIRSHEAVARIRASDPPGDTLMAGLAFIRNPNNEGENSVGVPLMPLSLGDAGKPFLSPTLTQYFYLEQWNAGSYEPGALPLGPGEMLDRASLQNCLGGRFSPGIDMTFVVRDPHLWQRDWARSGAGPFRIRTKKLDYSEAKAGIPFLTEGYVPLRKNDGIEPGDTSKFMALPWHTDYNSCATHNPSPNPQNTSTLFWSWPAQRPVAVYAAADVRDGKLGGQRYSVRGPGTHAPSPSSQGRYQNRLDMIEKWPLIGVVIQGSAIEGEGGVKYSKEVFLEVESLLDEKPVPPWPQNTLDPND